MACFPFVLQEFDLFYSYSGHEMHFLALRRDIHIFATPVVSTVLLYVLIVLYQVCNREILCSYETLINRSRILNCNRIGSHRSLMRPVETATYSTIKEPNVRSCWPGLVPCMWR